MIYGERFLLNSLANRNLCLHAFALKPFLNYAYSDLYENENYKIKLIGWARNPCQGFAACSEFHGIADRPCDITFIIPAV